MRRNPVEGPASLTVKCRLKSLSPRQSLCSTTLLMLRAWKLLQNPISDAKRRSDKEENRRETNASIHDGGLTLSFPDGTEVTKHPTTKKHEFLHHNSTSSKRRRLRVAASMTGAVGAVALSYLVGANSVSQDQPNAPAQTALDRGGGAVSQKKEEGKYVSNEEVKSRNCEKDGVTETSAAALWLDATRAQKTRGNGYDLMRLFLVNEREFVDSLGKPGSLRAFMTPTAVLDGLTLGRALSLMGVIYDKDEDVVILRCIGADERVADPRLATIHELLNIVGESCRSGELSGGLCDGRREYDGVIREDTAVAFLAKSYGFADELFSNDDFRNELRKRYSVWPGFTGLGYSIAGSGIDGERYGADMFSRLKTPEYLVKNESLEVLKCHCVRISPYGKRQDDRIRPDKIRDVGDSKCVMLSQAP